MRSVRDEKGGYPIIDEHPFRIIFNTQESGLLQTANRLDLSQPKAIQCGFILLIPTCFTK